MYTFYPIPHITGINPPPPPKKKRYGIDIKKLFEKNVRKNIISKFKHDNLKKKYIFAF